MADNKTDEANLPGFLKSVLSALALVSAWVFVVGWTYLHTYYTYFGINVNSVDFPVYQYLVFCYTQFVSFGWTGLGVGALLFAFFLVTWVGTRATRKGWVVLVGSAYLLLFWAGFHLASYDGRAEAINDMGPKSPLPIIMPEFKDANKQFQVAEIREVLGNADLRLLLETGDRLFVFVPLVTTDTPLARVGVVEIDRDQMPVSIRLVRIK